MQITAARNPRPIDGTYTWQRLTPAVAVTVSHVEGSVVKRIQKKLYSRGFDLAERPLVQIDGEAWRCRGARRLAQPVRLSVLRGVGAGA